jgi:hypothetical protein
MGSGYWSPSTYTDRAAARAASGTDAFAYSSDAVRSGHLRVHQTLDPKGMGVRESRDSNDHPDSNSIIISLDVTGSMGKVVRGIHADLPQLHELLLGHKYIPHPQIMFAAVGDATCDQVPLQVGQFESDNRMDQNLENMILEGGGGGQNRESYELMMYIAARHTAIDCWEKRQRKGYLFIIGDEMAYGYVQKMEIAQLIGPGLEEDIPLAGMITEVRQKYHLYYVIPGGAAHGTDKRINSFWEEHLGAQSVLHLDQAEDTSECIAMTIGMNEGAITLDDGVAHMQKRGLVARTIDRIGRALSGIVPSGPTVHSDRPRRL